MYSTISDVLKASYELSSRTLRLSRAWKLKRSVSCKARRRLQRFVRLRPSASAPMETWFLTPFLA